MKKYLLLSAVILTTISCSSTNNSSGSITASTKSKQELCKYRTSQTTPSQTNPQLPPVTTLSAELSTMEVINEKACYGICNYVVVSSAEAFNTIYKLKVTEAVSQRNNCKAINVENALGRTILTEEGCNEPSNKDPFKVIVSFDGCNLTPVTTPPLRTCRDEQRCDPEPGLIDKPPSTT